MTYLIHHLLEKSSDDFPEKEAVVHGDLRVTYAEIETHANQIAHHLLGQGVRRGDRVALLHRNSVSYVVFYFAILKTGAVVVPLNTGLGAHEIISMISDCQARHLLTESHFIALLLDPSVQMPPFCRQILLSDELEDPAAPENVKIESTSEAAADQPADRPALPLIDTDLSTIVYTSGSTGKPKGVMLSHLNVVANTRSIVSYLGLDSADRCMVILPFYYVFGKSLLNTHFMVSGSVVIDNRFTFPNAVLKTMAAERATGLAGVPGTYSILVSRSSIAKIDFPHLRYLTQAGGHLPAAIRRKIAKVFPDKQFFVMYGATEASARLAYLHPSKFSTKVSSFGGPIPNVELRVVSDDGLELGPDEEGEIVAKGSNIMMGYWNAPDETRAVLKDGWYFTGDLGFRDEDGDFHVTGRIRDMIKVGIHKVSAREVEESLYIHPEVLEAAVVGVPDTELGEAVKAFVVSQSDRTIDPATLIEHCRTHLEGYKVPKTIEFTEALPKNESGKIMKRELSELFPDGPSE